MDVELSLKEKCYALQKKANFFLDPDKFILVHVDGRCFSRMIKNKFEKPFDNDFIDAMNETAKYLCKETQAQFAYTQSDEISLLIRKTNPEGQVFFGGRICKLQSIIASLATSRFNQIMAVNRLRKVPTCASADNVLDMCIDEIENGPIYQFDCKVWNVDTPNDAMAWFLFRSIDCVRNSKQQTCQTYLSQKILEKKNTDEQIRILKTNKGIDWNEFTDDKKFGRIVKRITETKICEDGKPCERSKWVAFPFFDMTDVTKREGFITEFNLKDE